jgi:hypothetical protein
MSDGCKEKHYKVQWDNRIASNSRDKEAGLSEFSWRHCIMG